MFVSLFVAGCHSASDTPHMGTCGCGGTSVFTGYSKLTEIQFIYLFNQKMSAENDADGKVLTLSH